ncbi:uncharacterized protein LOC124303010 [Neodiprion virginianus]|uniref:uncharacterized protein LOC124303010 n=1 Tax=Neodiprion virginianus TaxID=2961670 RepID=UPI001EE6B443|nr:uncharacterized protein LOC124303010 [Neodiprion virginianus]
MGSPISPVVANLVLEHFEKKIISHLPFSLPFYYRYVDDIITCVKKENLQLLLTKFNNFHPRIQFTFELEKDGKISFLDTMVINHNDTIILDWHHKPTWSGRYIHFNSYRPIKHKKSVAISLFDRCLRISNPQFLKKNLKLVETTLISNGYPLKFINDIKKYRVDKMYNSIDWNLDSNNQTNVKDKFKNSISIPYIENLSSQIKRILNDEGIEITFRISNTTKLSLFSHLKSVTPNLEKINCVYKIPCRDCSKSYIGQTSQHLKNRISGHRSNIKCHVTDRCALAEHSLSLGHNFDFNNSITLATEPNWYKRIIKEMIHIFKNKRNSVNKRTDIEHLSHLHSNIL